MKWIAPALFLLILYSCKKSRNLQKPATPDVQDQLKKIILPVKFTSNNLEIQLSYDAKTGLLTEIKNSNGEISKITYSKGIPVKLSKFRYTTSLSFSDYEVKENIVRVNSFEKQGNLLTPAGHRTLTRNSTGQVETITNFGADKLMISRTETKYNETSVPTLDIFTDQNSTRQFDYVFDSKNGIFKNVAHAQLLLIEAGYFFFHHSKNNILKYSTTTTSAENAIYSYKYNTEQYPSELTVTKNNKTQTFKITYMEINAA